MKTVYTLLMNTVYPSLSTQVAEGTVAMKHMVYPDLLLLNYNELSQKTRFQSARIAALCL